VISPKQTPIGAGGTQDPEEGQDPSPRPPVQTDRPQRTIKQRHSLTLLCLVLACIGASWFAYQIFFVPQPRTFTPDWHNGRWITASDTSSNPSPVAYFRRSLQFGVVPDMAYITITANQIFRIYVNGIYIGSNTQNFIRGETPQTFIFDIASTLRTGNNIVGIRIVNVNQGPGWGSAPSLLTNISVRWGHQNYNYGTDATWQATQQAALAHPRMSKTGYDWAKPAFDATRWRNASISPQPISYPPLMINPQIYQQPMSTSWISAGAGQESYYTRRFSIPADYENALLRIVATGEADIFINDHLHARWNGLANVPQVNVVNYLSSNGQPAPYRNGLMLGIYDITPYLHPGSNTIAVHILAPGITTAKIGLDTQRSAMSLEILAGSAGNYTNVVSSPAQWHASLKPIADWTQENGPASTWSPPQIIGRPGSSHTFYLPDSSTPHNVQAVAPGPLGEIIAISITAVLVLWLILALVILRRFMPSRRAALETACLVFLPALALEALLIALSREPLITQPFPYTGQWGLILISLVLLTALLLHSHARTAPVRSRRDRACPCPCPHNPQPSPTTIHPTIRQRIWLWLKRNKGILPIFLAAIPMVLYNPAYEPYWQDELSSYYAARSIMAYGIPAFPSGIIYPKGELFSYLLALVMTIFGTNSPVVTRSISMVLFLASLPIFYIVGSKLFNRRVAWLATTMLALSPYATVWSRQTRMYELAQFMVIIIVGVFYWAIQNRHKTRPIRIAVLCIVIAYFSHEEVFITFPALIICALIASREGPYSFPSILKKKHWWISALIALAIISAHLSLVTLSQPPSLGTDQSRRPQIQITTDNVPYYFDLLFQPQTLKDGPTAWTPTQPLLTIDSLLAILGCIIALRRKNRRASYCALLLIISTATLIFLFTMQADRYYYPLLPLYYWMAAYGTWTILHTLWIIARPHLESVGTGHSPVRANPTATVFAGYDRLLNALSPLLLKGTVALLLTSTLIVPMLPLSNFNLFVSHTLGLQYRRHFADYDNVAQYMHAHMRPGDTVISVAPAVIILHEVGKVDHFFSIDRSLFLFEQNGHLAETTSGSHPLLNEAEFRTVLAEHSRIWLITDNGGYQGGVTRNGRFVFPPPDFHLVYEGYGSGIYFRSSTP
jgi:hypothetical protein